jgi:hypothetical protein
MVIAFASVILKVIVLLFYNLFFKKATVVGVLNPPPDFCIFPKIGIGRGEPRVHPQMAY